MGGEIFIVIKILFYASNSLDDFVAYALLTHEKPSLFNPLFLYHYIIVLL